MKAKHIIGCLMLAGACLSCSSDKEDALIIIKANGSLNVLKDHTMHNDATITIESGGYMYVGGCLRQVDLTIKSRGTLDIYHNGAIFLISRENLHIEPKAIIKCNGKGMNNDDLHIYTSPIDPTSSAFEKLDSTYIENLMIYGNSPN